MEEFSTRRGKIMEQPSGSGGDQSGKKSHWRAFRKEGPTLHLDGVPQGYSYNQLSAATGGFSEDFKVGQGGSGSVYRGVLPSGIAVAVKKINADLSQGKGAKLFKDEISIICRLSHRNLIELLGWCEDVAKNKYLLVYELMPNGSLDDALFGQVEGKASLSWPQRFNILVGVADALAYLHQSWKKQVLHRDIKSSNIMLDDNWNAKVGDFGIARLVDHGQEAEDISKRFFGTHGYISPEVFEEGRFTDKADVYAFGVVVLEVVCGRRVLPDNSHRVGLVDWVWQSWSQGEDALLSTVDKRLQNYDKEKLKVVLNTGLACCHPSPLERPSMRKVVQVLAGDVTVPSIPKSKPRPDLYFDPQISITNLLSFKSSSSYRSRFTYISDSAQASTVKKPATGGSVHSHFSIRRILKRKAELTAQKSLAKEKLEVVTEETSAQFTLHRLHHTGVVIKSQAAKQEMANQAKVDVPEAKADTGPKEGRGLGLRHAAKAGAETRFCTKNRTAEAPQLEVKMGAVTKAFEIGREAKVLEVPLPDKQQAGTRKMRQPQNVSQANVPSTPPLSDKPHAGIGKRNGPSNVKSHRARILHVRGETANSEQGRSIFASGIPVSAKIKIERPEVVVQRQDMKESRAKRAKQHPKVIQLREWCEDLAKRNPLLTQDLLRFKGHVESVIKRKNIDSWMKTHGFMDS